jgi:hypothetical protein
MNVWRQLVEEAMLRILKVVISLFILAIGLSSEAYSQVNNIWWNVILNYNNSGVDVCIAEQYNQNTLIVTFDVFPGDPRFPDRPIHGSSVATMVPYQQYKIFGWIRGTTTLPETCTLKSWR